MLAALSVRVPAPAFVRPLPEPLKIPPMELLPAEFTVRFLPLPVIVLSTAILPLLFESNVTFAPSVTALLYVCPLVVVMPVVLSDVVPCVVKLVSAVLPPTMPLNVFEPVPDKVSASAPLTVDANVILPVPAFMLVLVAPKVTASLKDRVPVVVIALELIVSVGVPLLAKPILKLVSAVEPPTTPPNVTPLKLFNASVFAPSMVDVKSIVPLLLVKVLAATMFAAAYVCAPEVVIELPIFSVATVAVKLLNDVVLPIAPDNVIAPAPDNVRA